MEGLGRTVNLVNFGAFLVKYCERKVLIIDLLKTLAKANAFPFYRLPSKSLLIESVPLYARRTHANVRHRV
jgi:hypothetical protein